MSEKIENATMNRNWIWNGKMYIDILTWNEAIEAAVNAAQGIGQLRAAAKIRKLKK